MSISRTQQAEDGGCDLPRFDPRVVDFVPPAVTSVVGTAAHDNQPDVRVIFSETTVLGDLVFGVPRVACARRPGNESVGFEVLALVKALPSRLSRASVESGCSGSPLLAIELVESVHADQ